MTIGHQLPKNRPQRTLITCKIDMVIFHTQFKMSSILGAILEQLTMSDVLKLPRYYAPLVADFIFNTL